MFDKSGVLPQDERFSARDKVDSDGEHVRHGSKGSRRQGVGERTWQNEQKERCVSLPIHWFVKIINFNFLLNIIWFG